MKHWGRNLPLHQVPGQLLARGFDGGAEVVKKLQNLPRPPLDLICERPPLPLL